MLLLPLTPPLIYLKLKKIKEPKMASLFFTSQQFYMGNPFKIFVCYAVCYGVCYAVCYGVCYAVCYATYLSTGVGGR